MTEFNSIAILAIKTNSVAILATKTNSVVKLLAIEILILVVKFSDEIIFDC